MYLDAILLCRSDVLHANYTLPFCFEHRVPTHKDGNHGLTRRDPCDATKHHVAHGGEHFTLLLIGERCADVSRYRDGWQVALSGLVQGGSDLGEALCGALGGGVGCRGGGHGNADGAEKGAVEVVFVEVDAGSWLVLVRWAKELARDCEVAFSH